VNAMRIFRPMAFLLAALHAAAEEPAVPPAMDAATQKAVFQRLAGTYAATEKSHDVAAVRTRRSCVEEIGDLRYPPSVAFLDQVLGKERDSGILAAAMVALGKVGNLQAVQAAFGRAMNARDEFLLDALPWGMRYCRDEKAAAWVADKVLRSGDAKVRLAAIQSLGVMECKAGTEGLLKRLKEQDATPVYEAAKALGRIGDERAVPALRELAANPDGRLREAAAFALGSAKDDESLLVLCRLLADEAWQVRESAVLSLRRLGRKEAAEPLIEGLRGCTRRVAVEIRDTLAEWTQKDFGFDADLWRSWWISKGRQEAGAPAKPELTAATYHGIRIDSDRALFVIDTSGSMNWGDRITKAKEELSTALHALDAKTRFNLMTFANSASAFRKEMVPASPEILSQADEWLIRQGPAGGTNTYDVLLKAVAEPGVDSVYFLSDGIPTDGTLIEQEKILAEINKANRFLKIRIHTVAFLVGDGPAEAQEDKPAAERFMRRLAEENNGKAVCKK